MLIESNDERNKEEEEREGERRIYVYVLQSSKMIVKRKEEKINR